MNRQEALQQIINSARGRGACEAVEGMITFRDAIGLLLSPQGREFALLTGFPWISTWRENASEIDRFGEIYLDCGRCRAVNADCVAVGETSMEITLHGTARLYHIMAMHGAHVALHAGNHAVVTVTEAGGTIEIHNDGTAAITIEKI